MVKVLDSFDELQGKIISIYGIGETARDLFRVLNPLLTIKCFIDASHEGSFLGKPIMKSSKFNFASSDCIIIASCFWATVIEREKEKFRNLDTYILSNHLFYQISELTALEEFHFDDTELSEHESSIKHIRNQLNDEMSKRIFHFHLKFRTETLGLDEITEYSCLRSNATQYFEFGFGDNFGHVIDAGAYDGSEAVNILHSANELGGLHLFEPNISALTNSANYEILRKNNRTHINFVGLSDKTASAQMFGSGSQNQLRILNPSTKNEKEIQLISIDDYWHRNNKFTLKFLKMDIEGYEEDAVKGALETLSVTRPVCAVSLYHKKSDLIKIPLLLSQHLSDYNFYIRAYNDTFIDTILYAIPQNKDIKNV